MLLLHIDALLDSTPWSHFFTKLELARYHQLQALASDRWKTGIWSQLGKFE